MPATKLKPPEATSGDVLC